MRADLRALAAADVAVLTEDEGFTQVLVREAMSFRPDTYPLVIEHLGPYVRAVEDVLAEGRDRGEIRDDVTISELALGFVGMLTLLYVQHWGSGGAWPTLGQLPDLAVTFFLDGGRSRPNDDERARMSTYVLMRILESAPRRYERGMRLLTFGRVDRAYDALAADVDEDARVLELGCGTGSLTRRLARRGARVKGIDANPEMLAVARERLGHDELDRVDLVEASVVDLEDEADESYDVVAAGLCFSELSDDELVFGLHQVARILRPGGRLLAADEVRPANPALRILHAIVRAPLVVLTYLLTQQTTRAVRDLPTRIRAAGMSVQSIETTALGKLRNVRGDEAMSLRGMAVSAVETLLRMLPFPARTGLEALGTPGPDSPVLLTGNFRLTVQRVRRALHGVDAWLLVANSRGVNVWCAATGGLLTDHEVVSVLKTSGIGDRVEHRVVILPQLAATGIDGKVVRRRTGWRVVWGPIEASDLPEFLASGAPDRRSTTGHDREVRTVAFPLRRRLEMAVAWAFPLSLPTLVLLLLDPSALLGAVGLVWGLAFGVFAAFPLYRRWLSATSRRSVAGLTLDLGPLVVVAVVWCAVVAGWIAVGASTGGTRLAGTWPWLGWALLVLVVLGVDLSGSTPIVKSGLQADRLLAITLDDQRCTGAAFCAEVCPKDVFTIDRAQRLATLARPDECVQCGACIVQCPFDALSFTGPDGSVVAPEVIREYRLNLMGSRTRAVTRE